MVLTDRQMSVPVEHKCSYSQLILDKKSKIHIGKKDSIFNKWRS